MIKKSDSLSSRSSDFVNHSYDYRSNWIPLGPIIITNHAAECIRTQRAYIFVEKNPLVNLFKHENYFELKSYQIDL